MSSAESHLEGVESGADAYITKPFSPKLLLARAFKLIEQREKLREKFSNDPNMVRRLFVPLIRIKNLLTDYRWLWINRLVMLSLRLMSLLR